VTVTSSEHDEGATIGFLDRALEAAIAHARE